MSLLVWLPLNGDESEIRNQGTANVDITNYGATVDTAGKLGNCRYFDGTGDYIDISRNAMTGLTTECTVSMWVKIKTQNINYATIFQAGSNAIAWGSYYFGLLRNNASSSYIFVISDGSHYSNALTTPSLSLNTWYHITLVYKNQHLYLYMGGELYRDLAISVVPNFRSITRISLGIANNRSSYKSNIYLNDFRIYSTALSPSKIAKIAQGLILHYPLSQGATFPLDTTIPTINSPYEFRQAGDGSLGDGVNSKFETIVGGSIAWNQLVDLPNTNNSNVTYLNGCSGAVSNDGVITVTPTGMLSRIRRSFICEPSHVYIGIAKVKCGEGIGGIYWWGGAQQGSTTMDGTWKEVCSIFVNDTHTSYYMDVGVASNTNLLSIEIKDQMIFDLTKMLGTTIANYVSSLETATNKSGLIWLRKYGFFTEDYYEYNPGEIKSVTGLIQEKTIGFNQWDEEWEIGRINISTGQNTNAKGIRSKNYIPVLPSTSYYIKASANVYVIEYDFDKNYLRYKSYHKNNIFNTNADAYYLRFYQVEVTTYNNDICFNISNPSRNGEYEPYNPHFYPLDSSLTLRGIPKLDSNNNLYYDGDTYDSDGKVTRKFKEIKITNFTTGSTTNNGFAARIKVTDFNASGYAVCDKFLFSSVFVSSSAPVWSCGVVGAQDGYFLTFVLPSTITDLSEANNWLSTNPITVVYKLSTPTIDQAPVPVYENENGSLVTIDDGADDAELKEAIIEIKPIQGGSGDPSPENVRPITGWSSVKVTRTGKNIFDLSDTVRKILSSTGSLRSGEGTVSDFIPIKAGQYFISRSVATSWWKVAYYNASKTFVKMLHNNPSTTQQSIRVDNDGYLKIGLDYIASASDEVQFELGSAKTEYAPYTGETYPITLPTSAGTVYGGTLDVTAGTLTVDRATKVISAITALAGTNYIKSDATNGYITDASVYTTSDAFTFKPNVVSDSLKYVNKSIWTSVGYPNCFTINTKQIHLNISNDLLGITDPSSETTATAKEKLNTYLAAHPVTITIPVAPQTYTLSPTAIRTLLGYNAFFADSGDIAITYETNSPTYDATPALPFCNPQPITKFSTESFQVDSGDGINLLPGTSTIYTSRKIPGKIGQTIEDVIETNKKVYDVSGMRNNAVQESITVSSDTPLYKGSYDFYANLSNNPYVGPINIPYSCLTGNWTIAWWGKASNFTQRMPWVFYGGNHLNIYYVSNILTLNTGDGTSNPFVDSNNTNISTASLIDNWHHYVVSSNGTTNDLYIDGEYTGHSKTYKNPTSNVLYLSGYGFSLNSNYKWLGNLSDFRIYTTPLSGNAIKDLYYQSKESITTYLTTEGNTTLTNESNAALFTMESEGDPE